MNYMNKTIFSIFVLGLVFIPFISWAQTAPETVTECIGEGDDAFYLNLRECSREIEICKLGLGTNPILDTSVTPNTVTCTQSGLVPTNPTPVDPYSNGKFVPLVGIPGVNADANINDYINALYALSISLAALLAVIKIIIAGVKWMLSDMVTTISDAKKDIQGALLGLLIVISAVVVLNFINPQLTETDVFLAPVGQSANNTSETNTTPEQPTLFCSSATTCAELNARCRVVGGNPTTLPSIEEGDGGTVTCDKPFGPPLPPRTTIVFPCNYTGDDPCLGAISACDRKAGSTYVTRLVVEEDKLELICSFPAE